MDSNEEKMGLKRILKNVFRLMNNYKFQFFFIGILAVLSVLFNTFTPLLLGDAINILTEGAGNIINHTGTFDFERLCYTLFTVGILYIINSIVAYIQSYYLIKVNSNIIYSLREKMMHKAIHMPMASVDENRRGDVIARLTNDLENLEIALSSSFLEMTTTILTLIGAFCMMLLINSWLTFAIICIGLLSSTLIGIVIRFSQKYFEKHMAVQGSTTGQIEELISSQELVRTLNYENRAIDELNDNINEWYNLEWKSTFFSSLNIPMTSLNFNLGYVAIAVLGSISVLQGTMSIGRVLSFFEYLKNFTEPIENITLLIPHLQAGMASAERIFEFIEMEEEENPSTKELETFENEITFDNISFGYTEDEKIIDNFSLTVKKGEKIAIIGETGAGKTTLIKLLARLYDIDSGAIKIDGVNINEYDKHSLRSYMGMVLQDTWLFSDTIKENIRYGNLDATDDEIIDAAKKANADNFIRQLPEGYGTILTEDGDNISQGQKQLLTIARAIISNKEILILDEATSNVDTRTEMLIQEALDKLMENKTSFIVAHRLSTVRHADKIIVLGKGKLIEEGTHDELLSLKGYYYNTLKSQEQN